MENINLFEDTAVLEPKCPKCGTKIDYGVTTKFNSRIKAHVCLKCNNVV